MKIVQINTFSSKSTGTIMMKIHNKLNELNIENYVVWGRGRNSENNNELYMNDKIGVYYHGLYTRLTDKIGFASKKSTRKLIKKLESIQPDIIHLHNIHGYYINIELLFNYIKKNNIKVFWTLHDCWAFTGHCSHFETIGCQKWQKFCYNCPQRKMYPKSLVDNSKWNFDTKKRIFSNLDLTIITPSEWLANLVKKSFLNCNNVKVIKNGIDLKKFKPTESNFRKIYNLDNKKILLGVATDWTERKGLNDFIELSKNIDDSMKIVLIGLNKKQIRRLPKNILALEKTKNVDDLVKIYSAADIFLNLSSEETFGLTTIEALACNTKVLVKNATALPEVVSYNKENILYKNDIIYIKNKIIEAINDKNHSKKIDISKYDINTFVENYVELYSSRGENGENLL